MKPDEEMEDRIRFPGIHVTGQGIFDRVFFGGEVRFDQACFMADTFFESAQFLGRALFDGASFTGVTRFRCDEGDGILPGGSPTCFLAGVSFSGAKASADVHFEDAQFSGDVSFRDASFKIVYFRESVVRKTPAGETRRFRNTPALEERQFPVRCEPVKLDLHGFSYERIFLAWSEALDVLEPYDVQPYRQMERAFRAIGKDREADKVYLKQRRRALRYDCRHPTRWLLAAGGRPVGRTGQRSEQAVLSNQHSGGGSIRSGVGSVHKMRIATKRTDPISPLVIPNARQP